MNPIRLLAFAVAISASLFAQDPAPQPEYTVTGPEELRQHVAPAEELVVRFLRFYDQGYYDSAEKLMRSKNYGLARVAKFQSGRFGAFESRELVRASVADTLPPEADATFVIFHYNAKFEKKRLFNQRVVVRLSESGKYEIHSFGADR